MDFPLFKTKIKGLNKKFDLNSPQGRKEYFLAKAGAEIEKLNQYLATNAFIAYMLGKKGSGKGTYAQLFEEIFGENKVYQLSIGDIVRKWHKVVLEEKHGREKIMVALDKGRYRGFISKEEGVERLLGRSMTKLLPSEFILALLKAEITALGKRALFIDGFPRGMDQVSYSLFFRDLIGYRDDPDIFVLIDIPEIVIDERMKYRRVCPLCQNTRNIKLLPTSKIGFDKDKKEFYLICDNPVCEGERMIAKEGVELGLAGLRERLDNDANLMSQAMSLYGIPRILLRNHLPADKALELADDYEITPEYSYEWDEKQNKAIVKEKSWVFPDDSGVPSVSFLAPPVALSLIKQLVEVLNL